MCETPDIASFLLITSYIRMFQLTTYIIHLQLNTISNNRSLLFFFDMTQSSISFFLVEYRERERGEEKNGDIYAQKGNSFFF
jgi:hypothetical protein